MHGDAWPELTARLKESERLIKFVHENKTYLVSNATKELHEKKGAWCNMNSSIAEITKMQDYRALTSLSTSNSG